MGKCLRVLISEKIRRLGEMSLPELRFRAAQQLRIARERWKLARNGFGADEPAWLQFWEARRVPDPALREALSQGQEAEAANLLPAYFASRTAPVFYFRPSDRHQLVAALRANFPGRPDEILAEADALCAHRFRIFGYPEVACDKQIPWRGDLIHGGESGLDHWSQIPYLDFDRVGDSKIVWEPNRHQHFITLGQAYWLTGDERYADECFAQWEHWQSENPYLRGINWASSLELAFRAWSWLWALHLFLGSRALNGRRLSELTRAVALHAEFIAANLSTYFSPNTHLLGEGFALFVIGLILPELRSSKVYREAGRGILLEQIEKQVAEDGSHLEQTSYYHRYAADFFLCAAVLADRNGCPFPPAYRARLERMVEFLLHSAWPSGRHPLAGDADGGRVLALAARDPNDHRGTLSTAAVYFQRGDFRIRAGSFREETLWLMGPQAAREFARLEPQLPSETSRVFSNAGLVSMRAGWADDSPLLLFDAGPQGMRNCAHGHADALSLVCSAQEIDWLIDPGTFVYTSSRPWRDFFRSTCAHNTVAVDGCSQAEPIDVFKWRGIPDVSLERWGLLPSLDFAIASHNGYARGRNPVIHRRTILFARPDYWVVSDELTGSGTHTLEFFFHFAPGVKLEPSEGFWLASIGGSRFLLLPAAAGVELRVAKGDESPAQGWSSQDYGHREPAPVLVGIARARLPARFHWILYPAPPASLRVRELAGPGLRLAVETHLWTDRFAVGGSSRQSAAGGLWTDAELAFLRRAKDGRLEGLVLVNGSRAEIDGQLMVEADTMLGTLDMRRKEDSVEIRMSEARMLRLRCPGISQVRANDRPAQFVREADWIEIRGED